MKNKDIEIEKLDLLLYSKNFNFYNSKKDIINKKLYFIFSIVS